MSILRTNLGDTLDTLPTLIVSVFLYSLAAYSVCLGLLITPSENKSFKDKWLPQLILILIGYVISELMKKFVFSFRVLRKEGNTKTIFKRVRLTRKEADELYARLARRGI